MDKVLDIIAKNDCLTGYYFNLEHLCCTFWSGLKKNGQIIDYFHCEKFCRKIVQLYISYQEKYFLNNPGEINPVPLLAISSICESGFISSKNLARIFINLNGFDITISKILDRILLSLDNSFVYDSITAKNLTPELSLLISFLKTFNYCLIDYKWTDNTSIRKNFIDQLQNLLNHFSQSNDFHSSTVNFYCLSIILEIDYTKILSILNEKENINSVFHDFDTNLIFKKDMYFIIRNYLKNLIKLSTDCFLTIYNKKFLYHILSFLKSDWNDEIQYSVIDFFYHLSFQDDLREEMINDNTFSEFLNSIHWSYRNTKRYANNLLWEMGQNRKESKLMENYQPIIILFHVDDWTEIVQLKKILESANFCNFEIIHSFGKNSICFI